MKYVRVYNVLQNFKISLEMEIVLIVNGNKEERADGKFEFITSLVELFCFAAHIP